MMMVVMLMLVAVAIGIIALTVMVMVVMMMLCSLCQAFQLFLNRISTLHCQQQLLAIQLSPRRGHDHGSGIMLLDQRNRFPDLFLRSMIGMGQHDASCVFDLIVEKLSEIAHVHLTFIHVCNGGKSVQDRSVRRRILHRADDIRKLSYTGRLYENTVGTVLLKHLFECLSKISNQRTANASTVHFGHLNTCILHESTVDADLSKLIFD